MRGLILSSAATTPGGDVARVVEPGFRLGRRRARARLSVNVVPGQFRMILRCKQQATSGKLQAASSPAQTKPQAASDKLQAPSRKLQAPGLRLPHKVSGSVARGS